MQQCDTGGASREEDEEIGASSSVAGVAKRLSGGFEKLSGGFESDKIVCHNKETPSPILAP